MEEVTKCSYINCHDTQEMEQIFHELPVGDTGLCVKWLINSGHENLVNRDFTSLRSTKFFICNKHFSQDSYLMKGTLKENAVPQSYWHCNTLKEVVKIPHELKVNQATSGRCIYAAPDSFQFKEKNQHVSNSKNFVEGWCRTCATKKSNVLSMTTKNKNNEMSLLSKLKLLIEIDDEDVLPLNMCYECVKKLEQTFQFFQQIYVADNTLRNMFPRTQLDSSDCYGISIDRIDGSISDTDMDPIMSYEGNNSFSMKHKSSIIESSSKMDKESLLKKGFSTNNVMNDNSVDDMHVTTVCSLLMDSCHSDEELSWADVLNALEHQQKSTPLQKKLPVHKPQMSCQFCNSNFKLRRQLKTHLFTSHPKFVRNMCMDCITYYDNELLLLEHRVVHHHDDQRYCCDYCQKVFCKKSVLRYHIWKLHMQEEYYSCDTCKEQFNSKQVLSKHIKHLHFDISAKNTITSNIVEETSTCNGCSESTQQLNDSEVSHFHVTTQIPKDISVETNDTAMLPSNYNNYDETLPKIET